VRGAREHGHTVLVACGAGTSRSVAFAAAALKDAEGMGVLDAVRAVRARHPDARPHFKLLASLCAYFGEAASTEELVRAWTGEPPGPRTTHPG
jgi:protein-tyrosine phosphatase